MDNGTGRKALFLFSEPVPETPMQTFLGIWTRIHGLDPGRGVRAQPASNPKAHFQILPSLWELY